MLCGENRTAGGTIRSIRAAPQERSLGIVPSSSSAAFFRQRSRSSVRRTTRRGDDGSKQEIVVRAEEALLRTPAVLCNNRRVRGGMRRRSGVASDRLVVGGRTLRGVGVWGSTQMIADTDLGSHPLCSPRRVVDDRASLHQRRLCGGGKRAARTKRSVVDKFICGDGRSGEKLLSVEQSMKALKGGSDQRPRRRHAAGGAAPHDC